MKQYISKEKIKYLLISAGVNLLIAALAIFVFGVRYIVDDDPSMTYIAYGIYTDPSARIVFSNVIFGWMMKILFVLKPSINWQVALYFAGLCTSGFISLYEILKTKRIKETILWFLFVASFFHTSFCGVTFTIVAAYVCAQGYFALFISIKEKNKICIMLSIMIIVYASMIRFWSVMAVSMFIAVAWALIVLFEYLKKDSRTIKDLVKQYVIPFVILVVAMGLCFGVDRLAYSSPEWVAYDKYNNLRSDILDNSSIIIDDDFEKQQELGIAPEVAASFKKWKFNDPEIFSVELLEKIDEAGKGRKLSSAAHPFMDTVISVWGLIETKFILQTCLILMLVLNACSIYENKKFKVKNAFLLSTLIPFIAQIFIYCYIGRYVDAIQKTFPPRMIDLTLIGFFMSVILVEVCCEYAKNEKNSLNIRWTAVPLIVVLCFCVLIQVREDYEKIGFKLRSEKWIEDQHSFLNDGHIYVLDWRAYQTFMFQYRCWQNPPKDYLKNITLLGGCEIGYPLLVEKEKELGIENPYKALYENENVYYLAWDYPDTELNYLRTVYDDSIDCRVISTCGELSVYDFYATEEIDE